MTEDQSAEGLSPGYPKKCANPLCNKEIDALVNTAVTNGKCLDCHQKSMYFKK